MSGRSSLRSLRAPVRRLALALCYAMSIALALTSCAIHAASPKMPLVELRQSAPASDDPALVGRWLTAELLSPGGDARRAIEARKKLDALGRLDMVGALGRALDDWQHGRLPAAVDNFMITVKLARTSSDPRAPLIAWFAASQAVGLREHAHDSWKRWSAFIAEAQRAPLGLGWRARSELVDWATDEAYADAVADVATLTAKEFGCVEHIRIAGPFGRNAASDAYRSFPAEAPGPWPATWRPEQGILEIPRVLATERHGCLLSADTLSKGGIHYAESYLELDQPQELLLAVQGSLALWIDDTLVLDRDPRKWGVWPKFGVQVRLEAGRHRVLARLTDPVTSIRVMAPDGTPARVRTSTNAAPGYRLEQPRITGDPNPLSPYIGNGDVVDSGDDLTRYVAAHVAQIEGQHDLANVLCEPLVKDPARSTGLSLLAASSFTEDDPIFDATQTRDLVRALEQRAAAKDHKLWQARLSLALWEKERSGPTEAVRALAKLADEFPEVPAVLGALSRLYGELGWNAEYAATVKKMVQRFPENEEALQAAVEVFDAEGKHAEADALVERIRKLVPDNEIVLTRALARDDFDTALAELKRLKKRHPDRDDIAERIYDVMVRAGNERETWNKLEAAIAEKPRDERARLDLADARFATGNRAALRRAIVDAIEAGASTSTLENALDLVEGVTQLEPYRIDALAVIKAYETSGQHLPGTAARVLDYAAVWVRSDGSSRMLEHEVVRVQSAEAIGKLAEHPRLEGLVLNMRVIKQDGRILEPEYVSGKPTVTLPHLEVGDYIDTEHITSHTGDNQGGMIYAGPHWFFREENIAYARSEFVVVTPKHKELIIETTGNVPPPQIQEQGALVVRRWRVDNSPPAPAEPFSAPATEFLPSVRVGWGITLEKRIVELADSVAEVTPVDPRIRRIAQHIVGPLPATARSQRAKRLYRWVLDNVEEGEESDGRRVVVSKNGNRWRGFITLCRALGIPVEYAVARNRLAPPPIGPIMRAMLFTEPLLQIRGDKEPLWLTVSNKYAPFGYVPANVRGMPAYLLTGQPELVTTPSDGTIDSVIFEGDIELRADGSAELELIQRYHGKFAMALRGAIAELPEQQLRDVIESRLLGRSLRGARLVSHHIEKRDDLDSPLSLHMKVDMSSFGRLSGGVLVISPPFVPRISQLATLPSRQTPMLIGDATHQEVRMRIVLPRGTALESPLVSTSLVDGDRKVSVADRQDNNVLYLKRVVDVPAGRIQPRDYARFVAFARRADDALSSDIRLRVPATAQSRSR